MRGLFLSMSDPSAWGILLSFWNLPHRSRLVERGKNEILCYGNGKQLCSLMNEEAVLVV